MRFTTFKISSPKLRVFLGPQKTFSLSPGPFSISSINYRNTVYGMTPFAFYGLFPMGPLLAYIQGIFEGAYIRLDYTETHKN